MFDNPFFYITIGLFIYNIFLIKKQCSKNKFNVSKLQQLEKQHSAKIDSIRKESTKIINDLNSRMLHREEENNRLWIESEREVLHVLNGVSYLIEMSQKLGVVETKKIMDNLKEIKNIVENKLSNHENKKK